VFSSTSVIASPLPSSLGVAPFFSSRHPWAEQRDEPRIQEQESLAFTILSLWYGMPPSASVIASPLPSSLGGVKRRPEDPGKRILIPHTLSIQSFFPLSAHAIPPLLASLRGVKRRGNPGQQISNVLSLSATKRLVDPRCGTSGGECPQG
jgi:hypothetical protein